MVVIDLQKAFDTVNHKILLSKLQALGLDQVAIKWFASYLEDRQQIVQITHIRIAALSNVVFLKGPY